MQWIFLEQTLQDRNPLPVLIVT